MPKADTVIGGGAAGWEPLGPRDASGSGRGAGRGSGRVVGEGEVQRELRRWRRCGGLGDEQQTGELEGRAYTAARLKGWKWFAAIAKAGYTPPRPLVWAQGMTGGDDFTYEPLAFLRAPLAGWMLYIAPDREQLGRSVVACPTPHRYQKANVDVLALDPTNEHLVVIYTLLNCRPRSGRRGSICRAATRGCEPGSPGWTSPRDRFPGADPSGRCPT